MEVLMRGTNGNPSIQARIVSYPANGSGIPWFTLAPSSTHLPEATEEQS